MKVTVIPIIAGVLETVLKDLEKRLEELEIERNNKDHPDYSTVKNTKIARKSPGDLKRLAVPLVLVNNQ